MTRPVVSPSLPLLKKTAHCANCQRSHRAPHAPSSDTWFFVHVSSGRNDHNRHGHSKETMEIFVPNVNKLTRHLPGDEIDGISAGRCPKPRKYGTKRRLAREVKKQVQATSRLTWSARKVVECTRAQRRLHLEGEGVNTRSQWRKCTHDCR